VTVAVQILAILAAFVGAWVGFALQFCIRKVEDVLILQATVIVGLTPPVSPSTYSFIRAPGR
jgi:hypothetical protein